MKRLVRIAAAAALLATAAAARPALAHPCDDDRGVPAPAPVSYGDGWGRGHERHEREGWRARELAELRRQYRALDEEREAFYARWGWHHRKAARYERHYAEVRARLDQRWYELTTPVYASRW